ncbi:MAG: hypothetical protein EXS42_08370 [Lacunisphaera sp.]|nr:hypothetical protein [Lacunisphaera sp.]
MLRVAYTQKLSPDPHWRLFPLSTYNQFILSLWEPLVECDPATGEPQPSAAESWIWSADRKVLTLKLRPDARWNNGDRVTAHDFVRAWLRLLRQRVDLITDGAQFILNRNALTQGPGFVFGNPATINLNALFANRIVRDPVTGSLDDSVVNTIDSTNFNVSERLAEGIDYSISYRQAKASWGQLTHTLQFNQVIKWQLVPEAGSPVQDWVGKFVDPSANAIAPGSIPEWKGYYNLLWEKCLDRQRDGQLHQQRAG